MMMTNDEVFKALENQITMPKLSGDAAKQVSRAYSDMFTALTYTHLLQGKSLGQSWFNAIGQIDSFIKTKDKYNSVTNHMQRILNAHRRDMAQKMMTDPNRDKIISVTPEQRAEMTQVAHQKMQYAMQTINKLIEKYREQAEKLKAKLVAEAKKRQEKLLKDAKKAQKLQKSQKIKPVAATAAKMDKTADAAPQSVQATKPAPQRTPEPARPQRPVLTEFAKHKAAQQTNNPMVTQTARHTQPAQPAKPAAAVQQKNNTAAQFINAKRKMQMLAMQRARIQMLMNQNQRTA